MSVPEPGPTVRRGSAALGAVLGVLTGLLVLGIVWAVFLGGGRATPAPNPTPGRASTPAAARTPTPRATSSVRAPSTSVSVPVGTPAAGGALTSLQSGTFFVVFDSMPKANITLDQALARAGLLNSMPHSREAVVVDTDALAPNLNPGYWAVGVPGAKDRADANAICAEYNIPVGGDCYARPIA